MKKNDLLLIGAVLLIALLAFGAWNLRFGGEGAVAVVTSDGVEKARLPLNKDRELLVTAGERQQNLVVVEDGKVYVKEATCPDAVCVRTGRISADGEIIVCLPHQLIVTVEGEG